MSLNAWVWFSDDWQSDALEIKPYESMFLISYDGKCFGQNSPDFLGKLCESVKFLTYFYTAQMTSQLRLYCFSQSAIIVFCRYIRVDKKVKHETGWHTIHHRMLLQQYGTVKQLVQCVSERDRKYEWERSDRKWSNHRDSGASISWRCRITQWHKVFWLSGPWLCWDFS